MRGLYYSPRGALIALQSTVCQQPGGPLFTRPRVKPPLHDPSPGALHAAGWEMPLWFWFVFLGFGQWILCTVYNGLTDTAKERMIARHARWGGMQLVLVLARVHRIRSSRIHILAALHKTQFTHYRHSIDPTGV